MSQPLVAFPASGGMVSIKKGRREGTEEKPLSMGQQEPERTGGNSLLYLRGGHTEGPRDRRLRVWVRLKVRVRATVGLYLGLR